MTNPIGVRQAFDQVHVDGLLLTGRKQMRSEIIAALDKALIAEHALDPHSERVYGLVEALLIAIRSKP